MATYRIEHREELVGDFYLEADSEEEALMEYQCQVAEGKIDFSYMEMVDSSDVPFLEKGEDT